jgi:hypothetical protein
MDKYRNKYRIASARLQNWDYGSNAMYFVTICTAHREYYFGDIVDGIMNLSEIGKIVETEWLNTFELRPDINLEMGEFQVMPNHFHAIIGIGKNKYNTKIGNGNDGDGGDDRRDAMRFYPKKRNAFFTVSALPCPPNTQSIYAIHRCDR